MNGNGNSSGALRIVTGRGGGRPGKRQQRFNGLIKKAAQYKRSLRAWAEALPVLHRAIAEYEGLRQEHRFVVGALVRLFDRTLEGGSLTKRERAQLRDILCDTARELLDGDAGTGEELKEIYNRHSRSDFDAETARADAAQARMMKSMLEETLGVDFDGADIRSMKDLQEATKAHIDELTREAELRQREAEERRAQRKKSARQAASEARRDGERVQVGKALQEVYRKLALALHPDHEPDPGERARKTVLMQEVNVAYGRKDLLQLLELQLRFEQIDQAQISALADDRLDHYNALLAEQVRQLEQELAAVEEPWRLQLDLEGASLPPGRVQGLVAQDVRTVARGLAVARRDLEALQDVDALKAWLSVMRRDDELDARGSPRRR